MIDKKVLILSCCVVRAQRFAGVVEAHVVSLDHYFRWGEVLPL